MLEKVRSFIFIYLYMNIMLEKVRAYLFTYVCMDMEYNARKYTCLYMYKGVLIFLYTIHRDIYSSIYVYVDMG
jgi:hypothetical protein